MDDTRPFPIQGSTSYRDEEGQHIRPMPSTIPWWLAEIAYEYYSRRYGTQQSLERLAERGGFGRKELVMFIQGDLRDTTASVIWDMTREIKKLREMIDG
jgi:hypothetical protein